MTTFDTPDPISVDLELGVGDVRIEASDRDRHDRRGPPERPGQAGRRDGRRADARRVRERSPDW